MDSIGNGIRQQSENSPPCKVDMIDIFSKHQTEKENHHLLLK